MTAPVTTAQAFTPVPLEQIPYFLMADGTKVYIGTIGETGKHLEANGVDAYFILATEKFTWKDDKNVTHTDYKPQIFSVSANLAIKAVMGVGGDKDFHMDVVEEKVWFTLPRIPQELVQLMDDFFREAYKKHGTESILLLTYDPEVGGAEGWGMLCPAQKNTSGHCEYDQESVINDKPDSAYIVGSAHSHPGMSAFASSTDHGDQADFDGIHITYGWLAKNNNVTEYHIELQMQGKTFILSPQQAFSDRATADVDPIVDTWVERVEKKAFKTASHGGGLSGGYGASSKATGSTSSITYTNGVVYNEKMTVPKDFPAPEDNIYIAQISDADTLCPLCETSLIPDDRDQRRCLACHSFLAYGSEGIQEIFELRQGFKVYSFDLDLSEKPNRDIIMWMRGEGVEEDTAVKLYDKETGLTEAGKTWSNA